MFYPDRLVLAGWLLAAANLHLPRQSTTTSRFSNLDKGMAGKAVKSVAKAVGEYHARRRARIRKEVLLAGGDWEFDPERKEMKTKRKGHKVDRLAAEKRANTARLMGEMPQMLDDYKKRRWERKMKAEEEAAKKALNE
ncbi:hypothetical protein AAHA92_12654 [Salvia divinorum]|uniref:Uncharacterized protein n=1 Tax=Salvia divinorum TaxID=28513 RepID=A0ABD1HLZ3_SALDI